MELDTERLWCFLRFSFGRILSLLVVSSFTLWRCLRAFLSCSACRRSPQTCLWPRGKGSFEFDSMKFPFKSNAARYCHLATTPPPVLDPRFHGPLETQAQEFALLHGSDKRQLCQVQAQKSITRTRASVSLRDSVNGMSAFGTSAYRRSFPDVLQK